MSTSVTLTAARANLSEILDRVAAGEEITVTRNGWAVAVIVRPEALRHRRAVAAITAANELRSQLEAARTRPLDTSGALTPDEADTLADEVRSIRHRRR